MAPGPVRDAARTRERILASARRHFAARGYDHATVRDIAADARVSPTLITRYFDGKQGLFTAATAVDLHVGDALSAAREELGARIASHVVRRWEDSAGGDPLLTLMRAAAVDPVAAAHMATFFHEQASSPLAAVLDHPGAADRASAVSIVIMGTVMQRYVLGAGPVAEATPEALTTWLGAILQELLTGPALPPLLAPPPAPSPGGSHVPASGDTPGGT